MSWAMEDWAVGLSGRALQKVRELQAQKEQLQREKQQRQLQLDSTETALFKQKQKFEEVRAELAGVQRELQNSQAEVQAGVRARERLSQELQVKQAQVFGLEGQLDAARKLSHSLTQEVKRLEAELEKLQNANSSGDSTLYSTPCWNMSASREHSGSQREGNERSGNIAEVKALHVRQLQFGDRNPKPVSSSPFPWQPQSSPPSHRPVRQSESSAPCGVFPWEREDTPHAPRGRPASSTLPSSDVIDQRSPEDCDKEADIQQSKILELQTWVQTLKQEVRSASDQYRESEARLVDLRGELTSREQNLSRAREDLDRANSRVEKEKDRAQAAEQRVKQLQEELNCQRQNAESSRRSAEQRKKDLEREHQKELLELQKESQYREKQHQLESNRLNQELQQARTLHNTLQAQCDKVLLQKQAVEKDLDSVMRKLQWTEKDLQDGQKRETQIQTKLTEALRERDCLSLSLEQSSQRVKSLEEEVKRLTQELAEALRLLSELQVQLSTPAVPARFTPAGDSFSCTVAPHYERPHRPLHVQKKKAVRPDRPGDKEEEQRAKYLTEREPGEGIDSDFIDGLGSETPETPKSEGGRKRGNGNRTGSVAEEDKEQRGTSVEEQKNIGKDQEVMIYSEVSMQGDNNVGDTQAECADLESQESFIPSSSAKCQQSSPSLRDMKRENVALREDLQEVKRELELRLEDLEAQRRSEAEARTKLKQLSRKHSSQAEQLRQKTQELREEGGRLEKQLEEERSETSRLRDALVALEKECREERTQKEREVKEEEGERAERVKLKAALTALESDLKKEQEEREKEKEEGERERMKYEEARRALTGRLVELEAELQELQCSSKQEGKKDNKEAEEPLTPLTVECSTNQNSNNNNITALKDTDVNLSSDKLYDLLNQEQTTEKGEIVLTTKEVTKVSKPPGECRGGNLGKPVLDISEMPKRAEKALDSDEMVLLILEVERLRGACESLKGERDREAGRAKQTQARLEALQSQVTNQTKQLTLAFENQSRHIEDLLGEVQERDSTIERLEEQLKGSHAEIEGPKAEKHELNLGSEDSENPHVGKPEELISEKPYVMDQQVTADNTAEQTVHRSMQQESRLGLPSMSPLTKAVTPSNNNDESVWDLEARLRDLKAEKEELRSKLNAAALLKELSCVSTEQNALIADSSNQTLVELQVNKDDLKQLSTKNEEHKSMLSQIEISNKQEKQSLLSENEQGFHCDNKKNVIVSGDSGTKAEQVSGREESLVPQESLSEKAKHEVLKSDIKTALSTKRSMLLTASTGQRTNDVDSTGNKPLDFDMDVQHYQNTIISLKDEYEALRSWALSVCPPDRQGELAALTEGRLLPDSTCELSAGCNKVAAGTAVTVNWLSGSEEEVITDQNRLDDSDTQCMLKSPPAQELTSSQDTDVLNLNREKEQTEKVQAERSGLKSAVVDGAAQQLSFTNMTGTEDGSVSPSPITALHKQLVELQAQVSSLQEENMRQAEELEVWRVTGEPISPLLMEKTTIHPCNGSIVVVREDQLLLTCGENKLVGSLPTVCVSNGQVKSGGQGTPQEDTGRLAATIQGTTNDGDIMMDSENKAKADKGIDKGTKPKKNCNNGNSLPVSVTMEGDNSSKDTVGMQTKATSNTYRDNEQRDSNHHYKSKEAECRISEAAYNEDSQSDTEFKAKTTNQMGNQGIVTENALTNIDRGTLKESSGTANEQKELVEETQVVENALQQSSINTEDHTTDLLKRQRNDGSSLLEGKGKEVQITKHIIIKEDTKMHNVQTSTQTENKPPLKSSSPLCTEAKTTGKTQTEHQLQDTIADVPKLVYDWVKSGNEPLLSEHSALCRPKVETREFQTQTDVVESVAFTEIRRGGDNDSYVCKDVRSAATQTDYESGGTGHGNPAPPTDVREVQHMSTQTELGEAQDEDAQASKEDDEENLESPPLSPTLATEVGGGLLFSGSFPIPADPARLAERIRRNRSRMSAAFDDTEYEPYGLPEVVMKGFADIPSGPACPYVLRRGLLGTDALPIPLREQAEGKQDDSDI